MDEELDDTAQDGQTSTDLLVEKDRIRESANGREMLRQAQERRARRQAAAEKEQPSDAAGADARPATASPESEDPLGLFRHVSPIEALGGAIEGARDLFDTADDLGTGAASAMGAGGSDLEQAKAMAGSLNPLGQVLSQIELGDPESGSMIREIANFATLFAGTGKIKALGKLAQAGKAGTIGSATIRGILADFVASDPEDGRAVDAAEGTRFDNLVFDMLQTEEGEGAIERRLKQSAEGAGIGLAFDTVVVPVIRQAGKLVRAQTGAKKALGVLEEAEGAVNAQRVAVHEAMGDPSLPLVSKIEAPTPGGAPGGVEINFARIESSDDVKSAIRELADSFSDSIGEAQRGVRTHETTKAAAAEENAFSLLMEAGGERGITMNAEETFAMRELWVASGRKVRELADKVSAEGLANPIDELAFRRQLAVHQAVQERVLAVRTETARALNQWRIPAGETLEFGAEFDQMVAQMGATSNGTKRMAEAIKTASLNGDIHAAEQLVYGSRWGKTRDAASSLYYFSMLSGPHTHMRNLLSNSLMIGVNASERKLANLIGRSFGDEQVVAGEASAMLNGIFEGSRDAFRITDIGRMTLKQAKAARKAGRPDEVRRLLDEAGDEIGTFHKARVSGESGFGVNKVEASPISAFSPEKLGIEQGRSHVGDFFYHTARFLDAVTTMPTRALSAGDEIAKTINARMELNALAYRQATKDVAGGSATELGQRYSSLVTSPDESMQLLAREAAERNTFTNRPLDSNSWKALSYTARIPVVGKLLMPFVRTPYNLATQAFRRTPLAPLSQSWRADLMAGGARTDIALAQFAGGTAAMATFGDLTLRGQITGRGPTDWRERQQLQRQGWQPYSVRIDDRYFSYRGLEPLSTLIGMSADVVETIGHMDFEDEDEDTESLVTALLFSTISQIQNKTYLQGLSGFFNAASGDSFALAGAERLLESKAGLASPAIVSHANRAAFDNVAREVDGMVDAIRARTPGLSTDLPPRRDVWGRPISYGSDLGGLYDFISPLYAKKFDPEPIDARLSEMEIWLTKPSRKQKIGGESVDLNGFPKAYDDLVRLSGNEITHDEFGAPIDPTTGLGMRDAMNALVTGNHPLSSVFEMHSPEDREEMIRDMQSRYLDAAKSVVAKDHPELGALIQRKRETRETEEFQALQGIGK